MLYELLYDAVALGMWVNSRSLFRVTTVGPVPDRLEPGTLFVSTHRAETDVPLICPSIYLGYGLWRHRRVRPHFAAREDLFERGFFAGFPARLPLTVRRALYDVGVGPVLSRLPMHPVPYPNANRLRLGRALAEFPGDTPLDRLLPAAMTDRFRERARLARLPEPRTARDVLGGAYADLLWRFCRRDELAAPVFDRAWDRRAAEATGEIRDLVQLVRSGKVLVLFPEGRPSPDGTIGPVQRGTRMLVRRGRPVRVVPIGIAYDPLRRGRPRALVAFGPPIDDLGSNVEANVLRALMRTTPLTCGQVVASWLVDAADARRGAVTIGELEEVLVATAAAARRDGRPIDPALNAARGLRARLADCVAAVRDAGLAAGPPGRALALHPDRIRESARLRRLTLEHVSASATPVLDPAAMA